MTASLDPRWVALIVLTAVRASMGFQFQAPASVSPLLIEELALGSAEIGIVAYNGHIVWSR